MKWVLVHLISVSSSNSDNGGLYNADNFINDIITFGASLYVSTLSDCNCSYKINSIILKLPSLFIN